MVTSPGGTTIEGCEALERDGMRYAVIDCINVATENQKIIKTLQKPLLFTGKNIAYI